MPAADIIIRGAREHNLQQVDLVLPRNRLIVMTGVSGSGKSSLAFDTLYAEGQRRYVESLSTYARQFLGQMPKPDVDLITGLAPSISIQQKVTSRNPRSTVGTITEIYDYLRVLYARIGEGCCEKCGKPISAQSSDQILESLAMLPDGARFLILSPLIQNQKGEFRDLFTDLLKQGFLRARVDGKIVNLTDDLGLKKHFKHTIEVVIDRLVAGKGTRTRLSEAIESALRLSGGKLLLVMDDGGGREAAAKQVTVEADDEQTATPRPRRVAKRAKDADVPPDSADESENSPKASERLYSAKYACADCGLSYEPPSPQLFSFNSPLGMCGACQGLGFRHDFQINRLVPDPDLSIRDGAIVLLGPLSEVGKWRNHLFQGAAEVIEQLHDLKSNALLKAPWKKLPAAAQNAFLFGLGDRNITYVWKTGGSEWRHGGTWAGFLTDLLSEYRKAKNPMRRRQLEKYMEIVECPTCHGERLNPQARHVTLNGPKGFSLPRLCALTIAEVAAFFEHLKLDATKTFIATEALKEIRGRLGFLLKCGLEYLALDRTAPTLSGGESQRIRLAGQIGCGLVGVLYILDEPSIGLHPRDNTKLLDSLRELRDQGNTVIVVEHDEETMEAADHLVDFGPGPGVRGGRIVVEGSLEQIRHCTDSLTGQYLAGTRRVEVPKKRRPPGKAKIKITGACQNNLQKVDVEIPLGLFVCVTGVSGSGKSSLVNDVLWQVLKRDINSGATSNDAEEKSSTESTDGEAPKHLASYREVTGLQHLDKAIDIDQSPIGRTPRSNPATYVKLLDEIRSLFTQLPQAKVRGYTPGRFSFNVEGGRCEACEGHGATKLEMDFLADIWVKCTVCNGRRFNHETLEVKFRDKNIADVLEMDVQEALEHFANIPKIKNLLQTLHDVGLDYLKLGQPSPTLSGGEAQRIKLARELGKRATGKTIYLLDEPTTGLHFEDVRRLLEVLHGFVEAGNTVLVVEHNLDVIKTADWVIDLGPEGGAAGGKIVVCGTPETVAKCDQSYTGRALRPILLGKTASLAAAPRKAAKTFVPDHEPQIVIRGAKQHNLQNLDVTIPRDQMSVFCGPSGSGKSSLAMDTLYAEGQRRYVESLSAYARQFLGQMPKPRIEHIHGLSPAIAIEQKTVGNTPRSTVGTVTEIYDYLRILFARLGKMHCPDCGSPVTRQTTDQIIERVLSHPDGTRLYLAAPIELPEGQTYDKLWDRLGTQGYLRVRINGRTYDLEQIPAMDRKRSHTIEAIIDRVKLTPTIRGRLADSIESALDLGKGILHIIHCQDTPEERWPVDRLSLHYACAKCDAG